MRAIRCLFAVAAFAAAATAPSTAAPRQTIVFGAAVSLTGPLANEGRLTQEGYDFWKRYVNGNGGLRVAGQSYNVEIRYADDESSPPVTARLIEKMIADEHVDFILGPYGSAQNFAAAAVVERHGVPMVDSGG
ncbi:MAG: ABC transporter substrate-binding protein, partial [Candidatus Velthaea sp.]